MEASPGLQECAVLGCGALGLTAALTAQRMGLRVTIYAKERPPYVRSARATGAWTPDSRIALTSAVAPDFAAAGKKWPAFPLPCTRAILAVPAHRSNGLTVTCFTMNPAGPLTVIATDTTS
jgi:hypothetical protein